MLKILQLRVLPTSVNLALPVLRVRFALPLLTLHGWGKLVTFAERSGRSADPYGWGSTASLALVVFAEVFCSALLVVGLCTRLAAVVCGITMATAFVYTHGARLAGPGNGELAFMYLGAFVTLLLAGGGRFSIDARTGAR